MFNFVYYWAYTWYSIIIVNLYVSVTVDKTAGFFTQIRNFTNSRMNLLSARFQRIFVYSFNKTCRAYL